MNKVSQKTVGIVGGKGKTGSQFAKIFRKLGFKVLVSDKRVGISIINAVPANGEITNKELIEKSDIVLFSVPLHLSEQIILNEVRNCARKDQIILDVSSLKFSQVKAMNGACGSVIGMHPLFGPDRKNFKGLTMILCPGVRSKTALPFVKNLLEKVGMKIFVMTPKKHDELMASIQVIPHLKTILAGELLRSLGDNVENLRAYSTPIYRLELDVIGRIFSQNGALYSAIIAGNPNSKKILKTLRDLIDEYLSCVENGDLKKLEKRFENVQKFLGKFTRTAFDESEKIVNEMQKWL